MGCGEALAARLAVTAAGPNVIVANATGCLEVFTTAYPDSAWRVPWIHSLFENAAAVAAGIEAAMRVKGRTDVKVIAQGGDGSTADIGLQSLSGLFERGHDVLYLCYDNEAYMNTGVQRSSLTPFAARTTTSPVGTESFGNVTREKDMIAFALAHKIPYVATASIGYYQDLERKVKKAVSITGPKYIQIHTPCPVGWGFESSRTIQIAKMAVMSGLFPLVEFENGQLTAVRKIARRVSVEEYLKSQTRFRHLFAEAHQAARQRIEAIAEENIARYQLLG